MKRLIYLWISAVLLFCGCAHTGKTTEEKSYPFVFMDVSTGLPTEGMWRQHVALYDMNNDGMLDIVAPPPRKDKVSEKMPRTFIYDKANNLWQGGLLSFPLLKEYGYGGVAVNDLTNDGYPDIVFAVHTGNIILLRNLGDGSFAQMPFRNEFPFQARAVTIDDLNGDGWNDIISFAELEMTDKKSAKPQRILVGLNKEGNDWEVRSVKGGRWLAGDSIATGDINGDGKRDILVAPLTNISKDKNIVWFGDGKGDFSAYEGDIAGDLVPHVVKAGDIDGDGKDEVIIVLSGFGNATASVVNSFLWDGSAFIQTPSKIELPAFPMAIDMADIDRDGKKEVVALYKGGIDIFKYTESGWIKKGYQELAPEESIGVHDLRAGMNRDGSMLIVYNLGNESMKGVNNGLRAYLVKPANRE